MENEAPPAEADVVDGDAEEIHDEPIPEPEAAATELVRVQQGVGSIIRGETPEDIIAKASAIAKPLAALISSENLAKNLGGNKPHVEVGGWQALGALLGALGGSPLHAETVWSRRVLGDDGKLQRTAYTVTVKRKRGEEIHTYDVDGFDWEARVEIRTPEGVVVGSAEAMCSRDELTWATRPDPAVKSMAETRAESRAYRRAVGWIVSIAGYNPTPAEEMPPDNAGPPFGDAVTKDDKPIAGAALAFLLDGDTAIAKGVWDETVADLEYMPAVVADAWRRVARIKKEKVDAMIEEKPAPEQTAAEKAEAAARTAGGLG